MSILENEIKYLRKWEPSLASLSDPKLFTAVCIRRLFSTENHKYSASDLLEAITDSGDDRSIDAVCTDYNSDANDIVLIQSKFLRRSPLNVTTVQGEINEIRQQIEDYNANKRQLMRGDILSLIDKCRGNCVNTNAPRIRIVYLTSANPGKKQREKIRNYLGEDEEILFEDDIVHKMDLLLTAGDYASEGVLKLDSRTNHISFADGKAGIYNISAKSLQELFIKNRKGLFGMNLRYQDRSTAQNRNVDEQILNTIRNKPQYFWYMNNGLVIVCRDFFTETETLDDGTQVENLHLRKFSIINGCQTTYNIQASEIPNDFFLTAKIIKVITSEQDDPDLTSGVDVKEVAEATNVQKPITEASTKALLPEQKRIRQDLLYQGVQYRLKAGEDKEPSLLQTSIESLGKLYWGSILQNPAVRTKSPGLLKTSSLIYDKVYKQMKTCFAKELIELNNAYQKFSKTSEAKALVNSPIAKKGRTYVLAMLCFISAKYQKNYIYSATGNLQEDLDAIAEKVLELERIIVNSQSEQDLFTLFATIHTYIMSPCFQMAHQASGIDENGFLQTNESYQSMLAQLNMMLSFRSPAFSGFYTILDNAFKTV